MQGEVSTRNVLGALICALDHCSFLLRNHHRRTTMLAYHLANLHGLDAQTTSSLVLAASIHDIGALYVAERDRLFEVDVTCPEPHEILGASMLEGFAPFDEIRRIVRHHHIRYSDLLEGRVPAEEVPLACFYLHLADRIDVLAETLPLQEGAARTAGIRERVDERFGTVFAPFLREPFHELMDRDSFWERRNQTEFFDLLMLSLEEETFPASPALLEGIASVFARVVDLKSIWTSRHSLTVARMAECLGHLAGLNASVCFDLKIAGLLHDIGKVGIPTELVDKPGPLSSRERAEMQMHVVYSRLILSPVAGFESLARWVAMHHEKHDHSGYPLHLGRERFSIEVEILAYADLLSALTEERPYRKGLKKEALLKRLRSWAPTRLDPGILELIEANSDRLLSLVDPVPRSLFPL